MIKIKNLGASLFMIREKIKEDIVINLLVTSKDIRFLSAYSKKNKPNEEENKEIFITKKEPNIEYIG